MAKVWSGEKARAAREAVGLSKAEMARRLHARPGRATSDRHVYDLENGAYVPSLNLAAQWAEVCGCEIDDLMDEPAQAVDSAARVAS